MLAEIMTQIGRDLRYLCFDNRWGYRGLSAPRTIPLRLIDLYVCIRTFWIQLSLSLTVLVIVFVLDRVP